MSQKVIYNFTNENGDHIKNLQPLYQTSGVYWTTQIIL